MFYLASKHKEKHPSKKYNFAKYLNTTSTSDDHLDGDSNNKSKKFNPKKVDFIDEKDEFNPIQNNDTKFVFDNDDAIIVNLKPDKK